MAIKFQLSELDSQEKRHSSIMQQKQDLTAYVSTSVVDWEESLIAI